MAEISQAQITELLGLQESVNATRDTLPNVPQQVADATGTPYGTLRPIDHPRGDLSRATGQPPFKVKLVRNAKHMWTVYVIRQGESVSWMNDLSKAKAQRLAVVIRAICDALGVACDITVSR